MRTEHQKSAGGVLWRGPPPSRDVCLIRPIGTERWQLPKGWIEPGEKPEAAAQREIREETSCESEIGPLLDTIEYWFKKRDAKDTEPVRVHKQVTFYLARHMGGEPTADEQEVAEAHWFRWAEARRLLTFDSEKAVLDRAGEELARLEGAA